MPLVFGIPTFDRVGAHPPAPWADLCSLLADCVYENVVLVVDDRMRLLEEIACFVETHKHDVEPVFLHKLTSLMSAVQNAPHSRILLNVDTSPDGPAALVAKLIDVVVRPLDFEYAFPSPADAATGADALKPTPTPQTDKSASHADTTSGQSVPVASREVKSSSESARSVDVRIPGQEDAARKNIGGTASASPPVQYAATHDEASVVDRDSFGNSPDTAASTRRAKGTEKHKSIIGTDTSTMLCGPSHTRTHEHIPLGAYQTSTAVDLARQCRAKTSFSETHDIINLSHTLGRAFMFTEELMVLDSVLGSLLHQVKINVPYTEQYFDIRRIIDSLALYAKIADMSMVTLQRPTLLFRTYCRPREPGPSKLQIAHLEQLVTKQTGYRMQCDIREKVGGKSAHDRYLVVSQCCVELAGGSDVAYGPRKIMHGPDFKTRKKTHPAKHFRFVPVVTPSGPISDVQLDLQRYEQAPKYVHLDDIPLASAVNRKL